VTQATLLLLTYNQEGFAAEAARAAFAQDYPDLQIILSDDRSPDETFAVLQREAAASGRDVLVRQTPRNLGLMSHLYDAAAVASGELIVIAAGDDVSRPQRVRRLVEEWRKSAAKALFSNWDVIDESGRIVRHGRQAGQSDLRLASYFPGWSPVQIIGATSAYARDVFETVPCPSERIFAEDLYLTLMLNAWRRPIAYVDEPLVAYRSHDAAITHHASKGVAGYERRVELESGRIAEVLDVFERNAMATEPAWGPIGAVDWPAVRADAEFNRFRSAWIDSGIARRLAAAIRFKAPSQRRWMIPRLLGLGPLEALKAVQASVRAERSSARAIASRSHSPT
jgi:glycosyltransferase involved in cell wall biosynthesis